MMLRFFQSRPCFQRYLSRPGAPLVFAVRQCSHVARGAWACGCGFSNYHFRDACFQCNAPKPPSFTNGDRFPTRQMSSSGSAHPGSSAVPSTHAASAAAFKNGDWICACGAHNFARRRVCLVCASPRAHSPSWTPNANPETSSQKTLPFRPGDWRCPECSTHNFRSRGACMRCSTARPISADPMQSSVPLGTASWVCTACHCASASDAVRCETCDQERPIPLSAAPPVGRRHEGDWGCPACGYLNFASRTSCKRCHEKEDRPPASGGYWTCTCGYCNASSCKDCRECGQPCP